MKTSRGLAAALLIVTAMLTVVPILMLWAYEGSDWLQKVEQHTPLL
jgi:hypothetical protein